MFQLREELEELNISNSMEVKTFERRLESLQNDIQKRLSHYFKINDLKNASREAIRLKYYMKVKKLYLCYF